MQILVTGSQGDMQWNQSAQGIWTGTNTSCCNHTQELYGHYNCLLYGKVAEEHGQRVTSSENTPLK